MNINATLIGQSITFFVFVWFCMKYIWPPLVEAMRARQRTIADGLAASERAGQDLEAAKDQVAQALTEAKQEGARIIEQARQRANQMIEEAQVAAREEGERLKQSAQEEINQEVNRAKESLRGQVARLAVTGAERILETSIDSSVHDAMLQRLAAELSAVADEATIARPYANALFELARVSPVELDRWSRLLAFAAEAAAQPRVQSMLGRPDATAEQKALTLIDVCGEAVDDRSRNFLRLLAQNKRLEQLPEIAVHFEALRAAAEQVLDVEIISAQPVSFELEQQLAVALGRRFQREVKMSSRVDASLMGGAIIRAGDTVIDGSVRGRLDKLRETLARP